MKNKNPIRKERYENLKKASALPFGKRMRYYFDFFKFHLLAILIVGVIVFFVLKDIVFAPDVILNGYIVNRTEIPAITDEEFITSFPEYTNIDIKKHRVYFSSELFLNDSDIESTAKLIATASAGDINFLICNEETFERLSKMGLLEDINRYPELQSKYNDRLIVYDHTKNDTSEDDSLGLKPYGIDISESAVLKSFNAFKEDENVYLCIGINSELNDTVFAFIDWIAR